MREGWADCSHTVIDGVLCRKRVGQQNAAQVGVGGVGGEEQRVRYGWGGGLRRVAAGVGGLRLAPLYTAGVVATGRFLQGTLTAPVRDRVVLANSTNVLNLEHGRIWTLVTSAFVTDGPISLVAVGQLLCLTVLGELRWGWRRLGQVLLAGNVVADCLVYALLRIGLAQGWLSVGVASAVDVGPSYGLHAVIGALATSLPGRGRRLVVLLAVLIVVLPLTHQPTFTDVGHLLSTGVGLLLGRRMGQHAAVSSGARPVDQMVPDGAGAG